MNLNRIVGIMCMVLAALNLMGCASIVNGGNQTVTVETWYEEEKIKGAECELKNQKGTHKLTTPDAVTIQRTGDDMKIKCEKMNYPVGLARVESSWGGSAYGNILTGGLIGAAVDSNTGAAYSYPEVINVHLGKKILIADEDEVKVLDDVEHINHSSD